MEIKRFVYVGKRTAGSGKICDGFLLVNSDDPGIPGFNGKPPENDVKLFAPVKLKSKYIGSMHDFECEIDGAKTRVTFSDGGFKGFWKDENDRVVWNTITRAVDAENGAKNAAKKISETADLPDVLANLKRVYKSAHTRAARAAILAAVIAVITD